tara:strand:- start:19233 stop:20102 length:870 start_codon:yes stop_codon:yes gene_type:complete
MDVVFNQVFAGLSIASILLIIALGLAIIYGTMGVINLAHGEFVMLGAYATWALQTHAGMGVITALPLVFLAVAAAGWVIEKVIVQRLYTRPLDTILATWGIGIILQQAIRLGVGPESKFVRGPEWLSGNVEIGALVMSNYRLFVIAFSLFILAGTLLLMTRSEFGMKLRAIIQNRRISECYGIEAKKVYSVTFAYGAGLAGIAGALITPLFSTIPTMGTGLVVDAFLVVIVGGLGSLAGTAAAALLIGEVTALFSIVINDTLGRIAVLAGIIVLIRFRPRGLFPSDTRR